MVTRIVKQKESSFGVIALCAGVSATQTLQAWIFTFLTTSINNCPSVRTLFDALVIVQSWEGATEITRRAISAETFTI